MDFKKKKSPTCNSRQIILQASAVPKKADFSYENTFQNVRKDHEEKLLSIKKTKPKQKPFLKNFKFI